MSEQFQNLTEKQ